MHIQSNQESFIIITQHAIDSIAHINFSKIHF